MRSVQGDTRELSDVDLLRLHVDGHPDAFSIIFQRHRDRLWAVALRTMGDREEAADALQDALLSAFRRAGTFRGDAAVTTWLHRIVVNACVDRMRRRSARPTQPLPDYETQEVGAAPESLTGTDPAVAKELSLEVQKALDALPYEQRAALILVDMQGYSVDDAARILDCAPGTIKSRCARGRARLLPLLGHLKDSA